MYYTRMMKLEKEAFDCLSYFAATRILDDCEEKKFDKSLLKKLSGEGLLGGGVVTSKALKLLEPYKVKNAVIMAAGMSSRFAPLSYEKPKALLRVKGSVLIERQIEQLLEAKINDITLVLGYMREKMFYLADKYNVRIVVNEDYYRYNNTSTLMCVLDKLDNTYICSSDNYFTENPFEPYVWASYYATVYKEGDTDEYCVESDGAGFIKAVAIGGKDAWCMMGHAYFSRNFSKKFKSILSKEYTHALTKEQLWEDVYIRHIVELPMHAKKYDASAIKEFDSLDELREFDEYYVSNTDSKIFQNISRILKCDEGEIKNIVPIRGGMTNLSFKFECKGKSYVYRHPGCGTAVFIDRKSEAASMQIASELGLDKTFIYMDENEGWKISHYVDSAQAFDYSNEEHVKKALEMLRTLHNSEKTTPYEFDVWACISDFQKRLYFSGRNDFEDMEKIGEEMRALRAFLEKDKHKKCLCHRDAFALNFLIDKKKNFYLIDWEYSAVSEEALDIASFIINSNYPMEKTDKVIEEYLEHSPSREELRRYIGWISVAAFYWLLWCIYQESNGKSSGEYLYIYYRCTKSYLERALYLYQRKQ